jgi:hypothetical protein
MLRFVPADLTFNLEINSKLYLEYNDNYDGQY